MLRGRLIFAADFHDDGAAIAVPERGLERFGKALLEVLTDAKPVDDDLDGVLGVLRELRHRIDLVDLAVDAHAHEPLGPQLEDELDLFALAVDHRRREDHQLRFFGKRQNGVDHLRDRHRLELLLGMIRAVRLADARVEQPQIIVNLGDRTDRRARIVRGRLLFDRNRWRQTLDQIDVGLFHQLQELPGVRRERFDVAALPLGVEGVERQRALARPREAGDDDQPVPRQIEIDVLEVMRACAANADVFHTVFRASDARATQ